MLTDALLLRWVVSIGDLPAWVHDTVSVRSHGHTDWLSAPEGSPHDEEFLVAVEGRTSPDDVAITIWTSGSSALPKGVPHMSVANTPFGRYWQRRPLLPIGRRSNPVTTTRS